jgi:hypothetical protein
MIMNPPTPPGRKLWDMLQADAVPDHLFVAAIVFHGVRGEPVPADAGDGVHVLGQRGKIARWHYTRDCEEDCPR